MTMKKVQVAVVGIGSAGLYALGQIRKSTKDFLVIDDGPLGTTCARVGCMPSKVLIQVAEDYHRRAVLKREGIAGGDELRVDSKAVLDHVRKLRDGFVGAIVPNIEALGNRLVRGSARFVGKNVIDVDGTRIEAERFVLAVGSRPVVPAAWQDLGNKIMTTDTLFEKAYWPRRIGVIGLGVIGLELGQALARLGAEVIGVDVLNTVGGISDPVVGSCMTALIAEEFPLWLGFPAELTAADDGVRIRAGERESTVDQVLVSLGRRSNLDRLDLSAAGITLDKRGMPAINPETMQIVGHPMFVAGDATGDRPVLHEAADEGRIAGYNAVAGVPVRIQRKPRFGITFTDPTVAVVGEDWTTLADRSDVVIGSRDFSSQSRAVAMGRNRGMLRLYGQKADGLLLGAAMAAPGGEHLAHLLAWAIQDGKTVFDLLRNGFYHPVLEEGLQNALYDMARQVDRRPQPFVELAPTPQPDATCEGTS